MKEYISHSLKETYRIAEDVTRLDKRIFALVGDLGSGKTTFTQAFLRAYGVEGLITSPTFVLIRRYSVGTTTLYHIDAYRLHSSQELLTIGFETFINDTNAIIIIEWADKVSDSIPRSAQWIEFRHSHDEGERIIEIM